MTTKISTENKNKLSVENKNIGLLSASQAIIGSQQALIMSVGALVGISLAPNPSLATLPISFMVLGLAFTSGSAALLSHRLGRTKAFIFGAMLAVLSAIIAAIGIFIGSFIIFSMALALAGASTAFGQQYRFAAADSVPEERKGNAISWVLLGGLFAGFIGPALAKWGRNWFEGAEFAGSFIALSALALFGIYILAQTKLPKAEAKQEIKSETSLVEIARSPSIFVPIITGVVSYGIMKFIMVAAPLAMVGMAGHSKEMAISAIQWHIISMFAPSLVTAMIISKFGSRIVIALGLILILACLFIAISGMSSAHFGLAMILLGIGWNFGFIGSTALLAEGYKPQDAARVQALNEQLVFGIMALVTILSGVLLNIFGWQAINLFLIPVTTFTLALLAWEAWGREKNNS